MCRLQGCGETLLLAAGARKAIDQHGQHSEKREGRGNQVQTDFEGLVENQDAARQNIKALTNIQVHQREAEVVGEQYGCVDGERKEQKFGVEISGAPPANQIQRQNNACRNSRNTISDVAPFQRNVGLQDKNDRQFSQKYKN